MLLRVVLVACLACAASADVASERQVLFCKDRKSVTLSADDFTIPWSDKEHHFEVGEAPSSITCTITGRWYYILLYTCSYIHND